MSEAIGLKLFISYSHCDEHHIEKLRKHLAPLKINKLVEDWYDRKIIPGAEFQASIDNNLQDADIICLALSADFLASAACLKEKAQAIELMRKKGVTVIPVILSSCGWLDIESISSLMALPKDGKPVKEFADVDSAWKNVYDGLKRAAEELIDIKKMRLSSDFLSFLHSPELLTKAHAHKSSLQLDDIFIWPELAKYDETKDYEKTIKSEDLLDEFTDHFKLVIAGESQAGKTTLCKKLYLELRDRNLVPIYVSDSGGQFAGKIENRIIKAFDTQYSGVAFDKIDKNRLVPIIDDFHFAAKRHDHINAISIYRKQIIVVDDIFSLNVTDEQLTKSFSHFSIVEMKPSYRNKLVQKWALLADRTTVSSQAADNEMFHAIDTTTELVNAALGKIIGAGIMPAYPFFILSVISTYEALEKPLDQEITSQGYCYQALIYMCLRKQGVKNDEVDTYLNFLSEFAFFFFKERKNELAIEDFRRFMETYAKEYNLPISQTILLEKLRLTQIVIVDGLNNYSFNYPYLYYFFVAKYLAEHSETNIDLIEKIVANLHSDENAYIAAFISHHAKNTAFLEDIILNSMCQFDKYEPATLDKKDLSFFDEQVNSIVEAVLPHTSSTPERERAERLANEDLKEEARLRNGVKNNELSGEEDDNLARDLRRSIKTVEVMGQIIKNRAGSLKKENIEQIFQEAMKTQLRMLSSFLDIIKSESLQSEIVSYISTKMEKQIADMQERRLTTKPKVLTRDQLEKMSKNLFWNTNFMVIYGFINKIIHSLGSNKLISVVEKVCDAENTPASFLIKHGILMWYDKNLRVDTISSEFRKEQFSEIAKRVMKFMIVNHCAIHVVNFRDKHKIESRLGIPARKLLEKKLRNS